MAQQPSSHKVCDSQPRRYTRVGIAPAAVTSIEQRRNLDHTKNLYREENARFYILQMRSSKNRTAAHDFFLTRIEIHLYLYLVLPFPPHKKSPTSKGRAFYFGQRQQSVKIIRQP